MEWKILKGPTSNVQMKLNQWKHNYHIKIHGVTYDNNDSIIIVLTREKK